MNFSFIFIGSTHSFVDDFLKQEEIIELVKPEFVLNEELENLKLDTEDKCDILRPLKVFCFAKNPRFARRTASSKRMMLFLILNIR